MKRTLLILAAAIVAGCAWPAYFLWTELRPYESNAIADSSWTAGGEPYHVTVRVTDADGSPLSGVDVDLEDPSGGGAGTTDANGEWAYHPDGGLLTFSLNGVPMMQERLAIFAKGPGKEGWILRVIVKDPAAIGVARPSTVWIHEAGHVASEREFAADHPLSASVAKWLSENRDDGWRRSWTTYASRVLVKSGDASIDLRSDKVVLNRRDGNGWIQLERDLRPADRRLLQSIETAMSAAVRDR
ncbi:MAG: hypothetical protein WD069_05735 [Planctomycetales bacterium]